MIVPGYYSWRRAIFILLLSLALAAVIILQLIQPIKRKLSDRFTVRGDAFFALQDFTHADTEYEEALRYNPHNQTALTNKLLADTAKTDIAAARQFFVDHHVTDAVARIDKAEAEYPTPKDALEAGVILYNQGFYSYAQYPLQQAVKLDPDYPEAWNYLGLTYEKLAMLNPSFSAKAKAAFSKRDTLTAKYIAP